MYDIEVRICSKNGWFYPSEARSYYGRYARDGITWHWWGDGTGASNHDNIVNYISGGAAAGTKSVNYVLSDNKISMLVEPDNVAWTSQSGNPVSVSVELQPTLGAEGYKKAGWLASQIKQRYGKEMTYWPHNYWNQTECPGTISLDRIRQEQQKWESGQYNPNPTPAPTPTPPSSDTGVNFAPITPATYVANKQPTNLYQVNKSSWGAIGVVKSFNQGDKIDIFGVVQNPALGAEWYVTKYSFDNKLPNGFSKADLDLYQAPVPTPPPAIEVAYTDQDNVTMYTLANAKLVDMKTLAVIKVYSIDTPIEVSAKASYNNFEFFVSEYAFGKKTGQGFLIGDLKDKAGGITPPGTPEPTPPVEPDKPEWVKNLLDMDDTPYWFTKEQQLMDITTNKPAVVNGLQTTFEKDDQFVSSAKTSVGGTEYRITDYSFKKGIFNGVPISSLTLTAPGQPDIDLIPTPVDPVVSANVVIAFLQSIVALIQAFIKNITTPKK